MRPDPPCGYRPHFYSGFRAPGLVSLVMVRHEPSVFIWFLILYFLRLRFKQLKELVELGKNNDPCAPVGGPAFCCGIIC